MVQYQPALIEWDTPNKTAKIDSHFGWVVKGLPVECGARNAPTFVQARYQPAGGPPK